MTNTFEALGLDTRILQALAEEGYSTPTPIQAQSIPIVLEGRDLLGIAQTGTGKTAAFSLPVLNRLAATPGRPPRGGCRVLVLSPTRELASQIADSVKAYGRHLGLSVAVIFGGVGFGPQRAALARGVDIRVATPGRLQDLLDQGAGRLDHVSTLVLDEADQMLDKGFLPAIRRLLKAIPAKRQTLFFSATMPAEINRLAAEMLTDPARVSVAPVATTAEKVAQRVIHLAAAGKRRVLAELLKGEDIGRTLVFSRTKHGADRIVKQLMLRYPIGRQHIAALIRLKQRHRIGAAFHQRRLNQADGVDQAFLHKAAVDVAAADQQKIIQAKQAVQLIQRGFHRQRLFFAGKNIG